MTSQSSFVTIRQLFRNVKSQIEYRRLLSFDRLYFEDPDKFDRYFINLEKRYKRAILELNGVRINIWYLLWRKISRKIKI
ncbi:MAG: hypothetical protein RJB24_188 [Candidatus Parcubacteria bacterium]|jgi:hypothetical protein